MKSTKQHTGAELAAMSDEELFLLVQREDKAAFDEIYSRYSRRIYLYCLKMLGDKEAAADIYHDTIIKVYEKRDSFYGGSFSAWIYAIARSRCINYVRDTRKDLDVEDFSDRLSAESNHDDFSADKTLNQALHKAIAELPIEFKEPLILRQFNELNYNDIAEMLGVTVSLAKVRVFRAIKMLKKKMSPYINELEQ